MNREDNKAPNSAAKFLDNLESFLGDEDPTGQDLSEELRAYGDDPEQLGNELRALLSKHAPNWKERAERERLNALRAFPDTGATRTRREIEEAIIGVIQAMQERGAQISPGAYHQKFQQATDADLASLLRDLEVHLEILRENKE